MLETRALGGLESRAWGWELPEEWQWAAACSAEPQHSFFHRARRKGEARLSCPRSHHAPMAFQVNPVCPCH